MKLAYRVSRTGFPKSFEHSQEDKFATVGKSDEYSYKSEIGHMTDGATRAKGYDMTKAWEPLLANPDATVNCNVEYQGVAGFFNLDININIGGDLPIAASYGFFASMKTVAIKSDKIVIKGQW
jgi:hypothetical protein